MLEFCTQKLGTIIERAKPFDTKKVLKRFEYLFTANGVQITNLLQIPDGVEYLIVSSTDKFVDFTYDIS